MSIYEAIERNREAFLNYAKAREKKYPEIWKQIDPPKIFHGKDLDYFQTERSNIFQEIETYQKRSFIVRGWLRFIYPRTIKEHQAYLAYLNALLVYQDIYMGKEPTAKNLADLNKAYALLNIWQSIVKLVQNLVQMCRFLSQLKQEENNKELSFMFDDIGANWQSFKQSVQSTVDQSNDKNLNTFIEQVNEAINQLIDQARISSPENLDELVQTIEEVKGIIEKQKKELLEETMHLENAVDENKGYFNQWLHSMSQKIKHFWNDRDFKIVEVAYRYTLVSHELLTRLFLNWIEKDIGKFINNAIPSVDNYEPSQLQNIKTNLLGQLTQKIQEQCSAYETHYKNYLTNDFARGKNSLLERYQWTMEQKLDNLHNAKAAALYQEMIPNVHTLGVAYVAKMEAIRADNFDDLRDADISSEFSGEVWDILDPLAENNLPYYDRSVLRKWGDDCNLVMEKYEELMSKIFCRKFDEIKIHGETVPNQIPQTLEKAKMLYARWRDLPEETQTPDDLKISIESPNFSKPIAVESLNKTMWIYRSDLMKFQTHCFLMIHVLNYYASQALPINIMTALVDDYLGEVKRIHKIILLKYHPDKNANINMAPNVAEFMNDRTQEIRNINTAVNAALNGYLSAVHVIQSDETIICDSALELLGNAINQLNKQLDQLQDEEVNLDNTENEATLPAVKN